VSNCYRVDGATISCDSSHLAAAAAAAAGDVDAVDAEDAEKRLEHSLLGGRQLK